MKPKLPAVAGRLLILSSLAALLYFIFPLPLISPLSAGTHETAEFDIPNSSRMLSVGEELTYKVSYSIFSLGKIIVQVKDTIRKEGALVYQAKAFIDSDVPFVNLHQVFYSEIDTGYFSKFFTVTDTKDPKEMQFIQYDFDYAKNKVMYEIGTKPKNLSPQRGERAVTGFQQDGLSLFFYARGNIHKKGSYDVPIFINEKSFNTHFNFFGKIGSQEIDAVNYPIETKEFDGKAEFTGIFGMTGEFRGYFSNDAAAVPIVAKMKVILGSVHIELEKWKREGWVLPKAKG
ncbi:MAG: DUF3108 domain-containing protein [Bacteroidetes bacterium]|nr:DUF3108 domain-containing protein [Bacteroidota bacterium]